MQTLEEFQQQEILKKGLYALGFQISNIAKWESELIAQGVNPLPTLEEIELAVVPDEPEPSPDWIGFNTAFLINSDWSTIAESLPTDLRIGIASASATSNSTAFQTSINITLEYLQANQTPIDPAILQSWQDLADQYNISVNFLN